MKPRLIACVAATLLAALLTALTPSPADADEILLVNRTRITFPDSGPTAANPFPSDLDVKVVSAGSVVTDVNVRLGNLSHTFPADLDVELVGPDGTAVALMSDHCGEADLVRATLFFDDEALASLPDDPQGDCGSGIFRPGNAGGDDPDDWAVAPTGDTLATFDGSDPVGSWQLYVQDDGTFDTGEIASGWALLITTADGGMVTVPGGGSTDVLAPDTRIARKPPTSTRRTARVSFISTELGSHFECQVDGSRFRACAAPLRLKHLRPGTHRVSVRAIDIAGNVDPTPAQVHWKVRRS